jgi:rRNA-processing protein CGR1
MSTLASSTNGRVSGKPWKAQKSPAVYVVLFLPLHLLILQFSRSHLPEGVKTKSWEDRMQKTQKALAIKKLQAELKAEKQAELQRFVSPCFLFPKS